jgi:8-oxo-dGTP pyrophosphatase MutT (NUDIX family)
VPAPDVPAPWQRAGDELIAAFSSPSLATSAQFVQAVAALATDLDVAPDVALRPDGVVVRVPGTAARFAREIPALAHELDLPSAPPPGPVHAVSVKGVVVQDGRVLLLLNERDEWELPGGRLEPGEAPQACVVREIAEEVGCQVTAGALLDVRLHEVLPGRHVLVVTYACTLDPGCAEPQVSDEHRQVRLVPLDGLDDLRLPEGYRRAIASAVPGTPPHP